MGRSDGSHKKIIQREHHNTSSGSVEAEKYHKKKNYLLTDGSMGTYNHDKDLSQRDNVFDPKKKSGQTYA
ncbi:hypothetical protein KDI_10520 [Dictyobacter arantiisoli]|uniref:Uncharacterized protein n=1 Tax=Dictyobacter arantiisoli TaxID=2014874 RepID=A0A5A5T7W8_9CHLR|nr:hypothetical protein KDI_10520 [Dictyobacter arantiisoli]